MRNLALLLDHQWSTSIFADIDDTVTRTQLSNHPSFNLDR
jgi:phosphatidate phosphatase APP1